MSTTATKKPPTWAVCLSVLPVSFPIKYKTAVRVSLLAAVIILGATITLMTTMLVQFMDRCLHRVVVTKETPTKQVTEQWTQMLESIE